MTDTDTEMVRLPDPGKPTGGTTLKKALRLTLTICLGMAALFFLATAGIQNDSKLKYDRLVSDNRALLELLISDTPAHRADMSAETVQARKDFAMAVISNDYQQGSDATADAKDVPQATRDEVLRVSRSGQPANLFAGSYEESEYAVHPWKDPVTWVLLTAVELTVLFVGLMPYYLNRRTEEVHRRRMERL